MLLLLHNLHRAQSTESLRKMSGRGARSRPPADPGTDEQGRRIAQRRDQGDSPGGRATLDASLGGAASAGAAKGHPPPTPGKGGAGSSSKGGAGKGKGKGFNVGGQRGGGSRGRGGRGGRTSWAPAPMGVRLKMAWKKAGKGQRRTLAVAITGEVSEQKNVREAIDDTFKGAPPDRSAAPRIRTARRRDAETASQTTPIPAAQRRITVSACNITFALRAQVSSKPTGTRRTRRSRSSARRRRSGTSRPR